MNVDIAEELTPPIGTFRTIFLNVGQGESTLLIIPNGDDFMYALVDSNYDSKCGQIYIPELLKFLPDGELDLFINTHPHKDHLALIKEMKEEIGIKQVWHSGHKPGIDNRGSYDDLMELIKEIGCENEYVLFGTNSINKVRPNLDIEDTEKIKLGDIDYQVLAPAEYVKEEIDDLDDKERDCRIHENCGVIRFDYMGKSILITGDSDWKAWQNHITKYHAENIKADILSASHHGSISFFSDDRDSENVYFGHMETIAPKYLVISAPTEEESKYDHPHPEAVAHYKKYIGKENIYHLGAEKMSLKADIDKEGNIVLEWVDLVITKPDEEERQLTTSKSLLGDMSHRKTLDSYGIRTEYNLGEINIEASYRHPRGNFFRSFNSKTLLKKKLKLKFLARTKHLPPGVEIRWQVTNTGYEAAQKSSLRGDLLTYARNEYEKPSQTDREHWESTAYTGSHIVQCFAICNDLCIAKSKEIVVNIE